MPKVKILPHPEICPEGAEFKLIDDESLCEQVVKG
jgi:2Fe-2S ferredoxin